MYSFHVNTRKFSDICSGLFSPPRGRGGFFSKLKNREEFEGGLHEKRKGKGREKKKTEKSDHKIICTRSLKPCQN